ncbi:MAG: hypothetical protein WC169_08580 [Dehalococcoidia bacterium]|jgi:hypothetical protein
MTNEFYFHEIRSLREELHNFKSCQITFLTFSVTATGILLGLGTILTSRSLLGLLFLFPLVFLLPAWWIFFDKATSITRIVGYYRILENLILGNYVAANFLGWENGLREFRKRQEHHELICTNITGCQWYHHKPYMSFNLRTINPFWCISYSAFLAISGLCVVVSLVIVLMDGNWAIIPLAAIAVVLLLISAYWNGYTVLKLTYGKNQYNCNECFWKKILEIK